MSAENDVVTVYVGEGLVVNTNRRVGLYHVFIAGLKPRSFPKIEDVQTYIFQKTRQKIQFVSAIDPSP